MFKLRYILCFILISKIDGESCSLNGDLSEIDSQSVENNELQKIRNESVNRNDNDSIEDNALDKTTRDAETDEQKSGENIPETEINNNGTECCNKTIERSSLEEDGDGDIVNEENDNRIDNDLEPTTDVADYLNKTTTIADRERSGDGVLTNQSIALYFRPYRPEVLNVSAAQENMTRKSQANFVGSGRTGKMFFKSCREKEKNDLCKNTLIDYPYSVSIQKKGSHYATGALLDKRWILTVAGEFYNIRESIKFFRARLGSVSCKRGGVLLPLQEVRIHPLYVPGKPGYDLGLVRMGEPVNYTDFIRPIRLSPVTDGVLSAKFLTSYWARLIVKGELLPHNARERTKANSMRVSTQRLIGWEYCHKMMLEMNERLQETSLCLKPLVTHHSLCMPDPGAPVVADDGLWGITSGWTSKLCYSLPGPTIFTRVSAPFVRAWLDSQMLGV